MLRPALSFNIHTADTILTLPPPPNLTPQAVLPSAGLAGFAGDAGRVELGILVEGDGVRGVRGAEDVAAVTAVVFAGEEREG